MQSLRLRKKTTATWLATLGGGLGLHRFYLHGLSDPVGWLFPIPTALGLWGVERVLTYGQDDLLSWMLLPLLGLSLTCSCLMAIVYTLTDTVDWNHQYNPDATDDAHAGTTSWITVLGMVLALMLGATAMMASLAFGFQRYFEYQIEEARKISQPSD